MKKISTLILLVGLLLLACNSAHADDYIRVGTDSIQASSSSYDLVFYVKRDCPNPAHIMGASNGFVLTATGDVTWSYKNTYQDPSSSINWELGGLLVTPLLDGTSPDSILLGGAAMFTGMPVIVNEEAYFHLILDIGPGEGDILIDSAFVSYAGAWKFSGLTCGQGGAPDRPLFVDTYGSDLNHPIHITVYRPFLCGDADASGEADIDDVVYLINFIFSGGPEPEPYESGDADCSVGVDIDDVVYLINYIFSGGNAPCDIDGDEVPDC